MKVLGVAGGDNWKAAVAQQEFTVFPENQATFDLFLSCATQWRWFVAGDRMFLQGFDYVGCEAAARMSGLSLTPAIFADLQIMETSAMKAYNHG